MSAILTQPKAPTSLQWWASWLAVVLLLLPALPTGVLAPPLVVGLTLGFRAAPSVSKAIYQLPPAGLQLTL